MAEVTNSAPVVAKSDVQVRVDEYRTIQVVAGTPVPPSLVEAYLEQTGSKKAAREPEQAVVDNTPKRGRARS